MIVILMGVSGSGKTTIGRMLSEKLHWPLLDADEFHSASSIEKMRSGIALDDADRWPWLDRMNARLAQEQARGNNVLLACSALKQAYRDRLSNGIEGILWIYLKGKFELIRKRLETRKGHYMKVGLLESQFAALEEPRDALHVDINDAPESIADAVLLQLQATAAHETGSKK